MKPKNINSRIGGVIAELHKKQRIILKAKQYGGKADAREKEELERIERLMKLEEERDQL